VTRPDSTLKEPQADDPMPYVLPLLVGGNIVSPSYYVFGTVKALVGFDVFGWASEKVSGDWEAVHKAGVAAGNLSRYNTAFGESVRTALHNQADSWHGNAADSAKAYFSQLAACLDFQVSSLSDMERQLTNISTGMRELGRLVGDLLQEIIDCGLLLLASQAAEAVLATSLVGAPAAAAQAAVSAAYIVMILQRGSKVVDLITNTYQTIYAGIGALNLLSNQSSADNLPPLPNAGYTFPGA
jgi:hypothetical protein